MAEVLAPIPEELDNLPERGEDLTNDPKEYLMRFENEINFQDQVENRINSYINEHPDDSLSEEDKHDIEEALRNQEYKDQLWSYWKEHPLHLDPAILPEGVVETVRDYWHKKDDVREDLAKGFFNNNPDYAQDQNYELHARHNLAAKSLVDTGLAPDITIARVLVQFMSVAAGYDKEDPKRDERLLNMFR